jgi:hypothetical protein
MKCAMGGEQGSHLPSIKNKGLKDPRSTSLFKPNLQEFQGSGAVLKPLYFLFVSVMGF